MNIRDNVKVIARMIQPASRVAFVVLLALGISGCGRDVARDHTEKKLPQAAATDADTAQKRQDSSPAVSAGVNQDKFPAMPADVPRYPRAKQMTGARVGKQTVGSWKTADTTDAVIAFYTEQLPEAGWTIDKKDSAALGATIEASKAGRKLMVAITRALPEGAAVNISHRP